MLLHAAQTEQQLGQLAAAEAQLREALSLSEARWGAELCGKQGPIWPAGQHGPSS